jgi:hypothetical protein
MRRKLAAGLLALATVTAPLTSALSADASLAPSADRGRTAVSPTAAARQADRALARATSVMAGTAARHADPTLALTSLRAAYPHLSAAEKQRADSLLGRPTDGASDPYGNGYTVDEAQPVCGGHFCVHYVTTTNDHPPLDDTSPADGIPDWVQHTLAKMNSVWNYEVGTLGYRAPASDGSKGGLYQGHGKFDVYLADLYDLGYYGYCAPEKQVAGQRYRYSGFCVLDRDFLRFPLPGDPSLRVTAAHEFFHAIQFNYDALDDSWILEATATWMEERYADDVNDNRQYIKYGSLKQPAKPLDIFENGGLAQYGNWVFFQRLSQQYGAGAIKNIWGRLDATKGKVDNYSIQGVKTFLASKKTTLPRFFADYGAGNLFPSATYDEGSAYPSAPLAKTYSFGTSSHSTKSSVKLPHLTDKNYAFVPNSTLSGTWRLKITVDGPSAAAGPAAFVQVVPKSGALIRKPVTLNASGDGSITVNFTRTSVAQVTLTVTNAGTQYNCWQQDGAFSCHGIPRDNGKVYRFSAAAIR